MSVRQKRMDAFRRAQQTIQDRNAAAREQAFTTHPSRETEAPAMVRLPGVDT